MSEAKIRRNTLIKLARKSGIKRISKEALMEVENFILELTESISKKAIELANHAKRMTVKKEDVELAARR
ncbi:MAG: histone [Candidatus Aenigmatarchaeota archaeon]|jgi:histone H3/H4